MVSFTEIARAIGENSEKGFTVDSCIPRYQSPVPLQKMSYCEKDTKNPFEKIAMKVQIVKLTPPTTLPPVSEKVKQESESESESESEVAIPLPTAVLSKKLEPTPTLSQKKIQVSETNTEVKEPSQTIAHVASTILPKLPYSKPKKAQDPICIGISYRDPMYEIASTSVKQTIEAEESRILESKIAELYKTEAGRSRGWTKTALEAFFQARAATGGNLGPKQAFVWSNIWTCKQASALLDFICLAKGIRLAVWNDTEKCIGIWPAADLSTSKQTPPLFHINKDGCEIQKTSVFVDGWKLRAALSVSHGLEKLSVDELNSLAERIGIMAQMTGKKSERVLSIAEARTAQRLR